jgi:hypothetical protein
MVQKENLKNRVRPERLGILEKSLKRPINPEICSKIPAQAQRSRIECKLKEIRNSQKKRLIAQSSGNSDKKTSSKLEFSKLKFYKIIGFYIKS